MWLGEVVIRVQAFFACYGNNALHPWAQLPLTLVRVSRLDLGHVSVVLSDHLVLKVFERALLYTVTSSN